MNRLLTSVILFCVLVIYSQAVFAATYAVFWGIENYPKPINPTPYGNLDALEMRGVFIKLGKVLTVNTRIRTNAGVTKANMEKDLQWLLKHAKAGDTVIVYFSGHGTNVGNNVYLMPYTASFKEEDYFSQSDMNNMLKSMKAKVKILIIDACNNGRPTKSNAGQNPLFNPAKFFTPGEGRVILASSTIDQVSYISLKRKNSIFTYILLQALKGAADSNKDGIVTLMEAWEYVQAGVPKLAKEERNRKPQEPVLFAVIKGTIPLTYPGRPYGKLSIVSNRSGAAVYIGGIRVGTTPFKNKKVLAGSRLVIVQYNSQIRWQNIEIVKTRHSKVYAVFQRISMNARFRRTNTALVAVTSVPSGATVYIDDANVGKTPYQGRVEIGLVNLKLKLNSYADWKEVVRVQKQGQKKFHAILKKQSFDDICSSSFSKQRTWCIACHAGDGRACTLMGLEKVCECDTDLCRWGHEDDNDCDTNFTKVFKKESYDYNKESIKYFVRACKLNHPSGCAYLAKVTYSKPLLQKSCVMGSGIGCFWAGQIKKACSYIGYTRACKEIARIKEEKAREKKAKEERTRMERFIAERDRLAAIARKAKEKRSTSEEKTKHSNEEDKDHKRWLNENRRNMAGERWADRQ